MEGRSNTLVFVAIIICYWNRFDNGLIVPISHANGNIRPAIRQREKDYYDPARQAVVAELVCNYTAFCRNSCAMCQVGWTIFNGKKINISKSTNLVVMIEASDCLSYATVAWPNGTQKNVHYTCKVTNEQGQVAISKTLRLLLKINLIADNDSVLAVPGRNLRLLCPSKNTLPPETVSKVRCNWRKDGLPIPTSSENYNHTYQPWLFVYNVTESQAGQYECELIGRGITISAVHSSFVAVTLMEPPDPPSDLHVKENSTCSNLLLSWSNPVTRKQAPVTSIEVACLTDEGRFIYTVKDKNATQAQILATNTNGICVVVFRNPAGATVSRRNVTKPCYIQGDKHQPMDAYIVPLISSAGIVGLIIIAIFIALCFRHSVCGKRNEPSVPDAETSPADLPKGDQEMDGKLNALSKKVDVLEKVQMESVDLASDQIR
eukprot:m.25408 g.25408  ORF g.25408 m.25408 type:complete len:433 (+) comp28800_c0_seq1:603-1901(+)